METIENKGYASTGLAGTALGLGAGAVGVQLLNGTLGNLFGNNRPQPPVPELATLRDLDYERQLTGKDAQIGKLEAQLYTNERLAAVEERLQDKIDALEEKLNSASAAQALINERQSGAIGMLQAQAMEVKRIFGTYIAGPTMAASEAVYNAFKPVATAATTAAAAG